MEIKITGTEKTARKLADLGKLSASVVPGARRKALRSGRVRAVRDVGLVLNQPAAKLRERIDSDRVALFVVRGEKEKHPILTEKQSSESMTFRGKFIMHGQRSAGFKVKIWRGLGVQFIKPAFRIPGRSVPFVRTGPTRDSPIRPLFGPRVGVIFNQINVTLRDFMRDRVTLEWRKAIRGRLARR